MTWAVSLRPLPTKPASPTISPARTEKEISRVKGGRFSLRTSSTTSPICATCLGKRFSILRPTIMLINSASLVSATCWVPIVSPSRSTVTRSASSKTSLRR